jgi:hypothetical protein
MVESGRFDGKPKALEVRQVCNFPNFDKRVDCKEVISNFSLKSSLSYLGNKKTDVRGVPGDSRDGVEVENRK